MFNTSFNDSFQNVVPNENTDINPYQDQYFGRHDTTPYTQAMNPPMPAASPNMDNQYYPLQASLATPGLSDPVGYAKGGQAKKSGGKKKRAEMNNPYPALAEMIRQQGTGGDVILAHINPLEAQILGLMSGGGSINPVTGIPQFRGKPWYKKAAKFISSNAGKVVGSVVGNMILPGVGGIIGGALGGGTESSVQGKGFGRGALMGGLTGALLPSAASAAGWGAGKIGASGVGGTLSRYGSDNAILPSLGKMFGVGSGEHNAASYIGGSRTPQSILGARVLGGGGAQPRGGFIPQMSGVSAGDDYAQPEEKSFLDSLMGNTKSYLSQPANLLATASTIGSFMNRPKEMTPERRAEEQKRYNKALMLSPQEMAAKEANDLAEEHARRRIARRKFLPEERLGNIDPVYRKTHTPAEHEATGRWMSYYSDPQFSGDPINFKDGGYAHMPTVYEAGEVQYPSGLGVFLEGHTGGQDDEIPALLSDGEYIIDASTVANLGDGNNRAGAKKLDQMIVNIRKHKGGSTKLPPKAKSLASYIKG